MASEVGVLDVEPENVKIKGRLQPGKMFLVDFAQGRIIDDEELKHEIAGKRPYKQWLKEQRLTLEEIVENYKGSNGKSENGDRVMRVTGDFPSCGRCRPSATRPRRCTSCSSR